MKYLITLLIFNLIFSTEWIELDSTNSESNYQKKILSSNDNNIRLELNLSGFYQTQVETPKGNAYIINAKNGASLLKHGAPDLDKIAIPIQIPNQANMNYRIVSNEYTDIQNINIAPSKGNLTRDIDPNSIPYYYGEEYQKNEFYPIQTIEFSSPYILRNLRGQTLIINPFQYNLILKH